MWAKTKIKQSKTNKQKGQKSPIECNELTNLTSYTVFLGSCAYSSHSYEETDKNHCNSHEAYPKHFYILQCFPICARLGLGTATGKDMDD